MSSGAITSLPSEIFEHFLKFQNISFSDILNFSLTCKHFYETIKKDNNLWKTKFLQAWPSLKEIYEAKKHDGRIINWKEESKVCIEVKRKLAEILANMSQKYYQKSELSISELEEFDPLFLPECGSHPYGYYFIMSDLMRLLEQPAISTNLTHRYYARKVIRYIKQIHLMSRWRKMIELPKEEQTYEKGATFVAQWCQPDRDVRYSDIAASLDNLAEQSKDALRETNPNHPVFFIEEEKFKEWNMKTLSDNYWSPECSREIIAAMCSVLFTKLKFFASSEMYYISKHFYIDRVLETKHGIPIIIAVIFESVSRRLGVRCEAANFPSHFLLRWQESYDNANEHECYYIDVCNNGKFLTKQDCPRLGGIDRCPLAQYNKSRVTAGMLQVVSKIANNLGPATTECSHVNGEMTRIRSILELRITIEPSDVNAMLQLGRFYTLHHLDMGGFPKIFQNIQKDFTPDSCRVTVVMRMLETIKKHLRFDDKIVPKRRTPDVRFAVGLIMRHRTLGYICVIAGWDPVWCGGSSEWINEVDIQYLPQGTKQPFYYVLADNGSCHYVAQDNLQLAKPPCWINHGEIGRYFNEFCETHYHPNPEKQKEYPEDESIRLSWLRQL